MFSETKGKQCLYARSFLSHTGVASKACSHQLLGCPIFSHHGYLHHHVITFIVITPINSTPRMSQSSYPLTIVTAFIYTHTCISSVCWLLFPSSWYQTAYSLGESGINHLNEEGQKSIILSVHFERLVVAARATELRKHVKALSTLSRLCRKRMPWLIHSVCLEDRIEIEWVTCGT